MHRTGPIMKAILSASTAEVAIRYLGRVGEPALRTLMEPQNGRIPRPDVKVG